MTDNSLIKIMEDNKKEQNFKKIMELSDEINFLAGCIKDFKGQRMIDLKIVCENEKYMPSYANDTDACMDVKIKTDSFVSTIIKPNETKVFGTGIKVAIPKDHVMLVFPRSSTGFKLNCRFANSTGIIDSGYRDEIKIALNNFGKLPVLVEDGQRIAQFMIIPRPKIELIQVEDNDDFRNGDRGGGIGSTGEV